jgi:Phage integrase family
MVKAVAVTWLFAGLRSDELIRLRVGCIRSESENVIVTGTCDTLPKDTVCLIEIPVNKTGNSFTKPVDPLVGQAIAAWEKVRPEQPTALDSKTCEWVHYLFSLRGKRLGHEYVNKTLIPILCRKAGIPESDAKGRITSHRARHTIATQLFNARDPMSLTELQAWLGHSSPHSTQYYARITPTRLMKSYADAGYFNHALRTIEVLIDQQAIKEAAASHGQPWMYYDLGHGLCTYDYFSQCPHRLACARCDFYIPKQSSRAQMLESKGNLLRLKQEITLTDEEIAAVDEGVELMNKLIDKLADIPTPAGPTPREIRINSGHESPVLSDTPDQGPRLVLMSENFINK